MPACFVLRVTLSAAHAFLSLRCKIHHLETVRRSLTRVIFVVRGELKLKEYTDDPLHQNKGHYAEYAAQLENGGLHFRTRATGAELRVGPNSMDGYTYRPNSIQTPENAIGTLKLDRDPIKSEAFCYPTLRTPADRYR